MKFYGKIIYGQIVLLLIVFQALPDRLGGCLSNAGTNYGWPFPGLIRFWKESTNAEWTYPPGGFEPLFLAIFLNAALVAALLAVVVITIRYMQSKWFMWSKPQLLVNLGAYGLLLSLNVGFGFWHIRSLQAFREASVFFFEGWPIPSHYITEVNGSDFKTIAELSYISFLNLFMVLSIPLILGVLSRRILTIKAEQNGAAPSRD